MNYWLVKSERSTYSWDDLTQDKNTCWNGIRNDAAHIHLREMKKEFDTVLKLGNTLL